MIDYDYVLPVVYEEAREAGAVADDPDEDFVPLGQDQHEAGENLKLKMLAVRYFFKQY